MFHFHSNAKNVKTYLTSKFTQANDFKVIGTCKLSIKKFQNNFCCKILWPISLGSCLSKKDIGSNLISIDYFLIWKLIVPFLGNLKNDKNNKLLEKKFKNGVGFSKPL
jgi:hypothetical protein